MNGCCITNWIINVIVFQLLLSSCSYKLLQDDRPVVLGHGGMGIKSLLLFDSEESLLKASNRFDGTEGDIQITADGKLVFWHDVYYRGEYLHKLNYDNLSLRHLLFKTNKLALVENVLDDIPAGKTVSFDVKLYGCDEGCKRMLVNKLVPVVNKYGYKLELLLETHDKFLIELLQNLKGLKVFYYAGNSVDAINMCSSGKIYGISIKHNLISLDEVKALQKKGCKIMLWGIKNKKQLKSVLLKHPDYIQTDFTGIKLFNTNK